MKTMLLAVLIFLLLLTPIFVNIPKVGATTTEDLSITPALPEDVPCEPMPENYTTEDYLNTTNPYSQVNPLGEETDEEGSHPLYVLVFGDEEERDVIRGDPSNPVSWDGYARLQLERGDESLVANFGIDIRILGFLEWDSDDSLDNMYDLWYELEEDTEQYLRTWYDGEWWSNYVDAVIGITSQVDPYPVAGLAPGPEFLDQGRIFTLLNWQVYWADDNLVQHEVSHLFYADDHIPTCCVMAGHTHFQTLIWEDLLWWVFNDIPCVYTAYSWCTSCSQTIQQNSGRYPLRTLTISASSGGTTNPTPGTYIYGNGGSVAVAASAYSGYTFNYWLLDGATVYDNPITVTMDSDHTLEAYFAEPVCAMKTMTDGYFYVPNVATGLLKIEMLFDDSGIEGDQTGGTTPYGSIVNYPDGIVDGVDLGLIGLNWGTSGIYITDLTGVTVAFDTGEVLSLDENGFVMIPQDATSFHVTRYGNPIGAMITFWP